MADYYFSQLPDDILCRVFSFLTLREAARTRSLTSSWRYLPDTRSVLQFDTFTVFGKETRYFITSNKIAFQSKFVGMVDRFLLELWRGNKISRLIVNYGLENEHASHIDKWIMTAVRMDVEEIELDFSHSFNDRETYAFSASRLLEDSEKKASCLKRIRLKNCRIVPNLSPPMREKSWLGRLTTLELSYVPLHQSGVECILSSCALHLVSLSLIHCCLPSMFCITGQLICLKKLVVEDHLKQIKLDAPNLQEFEYWGQAKKMTFDHVPKLRKAVLWFGFRIGGNSLVFDELTRKASRLEALTLTIRTEVQPLPVGIIRARLRKLVLRALIPYGFDFLCLTYMLHASLFLEILDIELRLWSDSIRSSRSDSIRSSSSSSPRYSKRPIFRLKEVKISTIGCPFMELALYLVRHAMVLKRMVIESPYPYPSEWKEKVTNTLTQNRYNPGTQVIIQDMKI